MINEGLKGSKIKLANSKDIQAFMNTNRKTNRSRIRDFEAYRHNSSSYRAPSMTELRDDQLNNSNQLPNSVNTSNMYPAIKEQKNQKDEEMKPYNF